MSELPDFTVCKKCGKIQLKHPPVLFADIREGDFVKNNMCKDCKFSITNFLRAVFKKEESK